MIYSGVIFAIIFFKMTFLLRFSCFRSHLGWCKVEVRVAFFKAIFFLCFTNVESHIVIDVYLLHFFKQIVHPHNLFIHA